MKTIEFNEVSYWYPNADEPAINDVSFSVSPGEFLLVVGSTGCGKSTLLKCINGLVPHFTGGKIKGSITVCGLNPTETPTKKVAQHVGFVFQDPENQFIMSTVESELAFGLENLRLSVNEISERISQVSSYFNLSHIINKKVSELSGGEKQKVVLASVLAMRPKVIVLDEPTSQLDPESASNLLYSLNSLNSDFGLTVVLADHRIDRVYPFVNKVLDLDCGVIGKPEDILPNSVNSPALLKLSKDLKDKRINIGHPKTVSEAKINLKKHLKKFNSKKIKSRKKGVVVVSIRKLSKSFNGKKVLNNINLDFFRGEFTVIMGRNGAGKSTLIKHLNGLLQPDFGSIQVKGMSPASFPIEEMARKIGFVSQNPNNYLFSETVSEELAFTARNLNSLPDIERILENLNLSSKKNLYPRDLSGGERQKVAIGSILTGEPDILVFDEPTRGMDSDSKHQLISLLKEFTDQGKTVVVVTHDVETAAESADRIIILDNGVITADGPATKVLNGNNLFQTQINKLFPTKNYLTVDDALKGLT